jgi:hypothetical protein
MARFRYNFNILTNRKTFRDLKDDSPLRTLLATIRSELSERDGSTLEFVSDGLNPVYDARFISCASGEDLDYWGETLALARNVSESDDGYRTRLLDELRDFTEALTAEGIKGRVYDIINSYPAIIEHHSLAPDWPLDWSDVSEGWTTWAPWEELVDFLLVLPSGLTEAQIEQVANAVADVKFAPARCLMVTDSGSGYYNLVKLVE